jgi:hypothetical protein
MFPGFDPSRLDPKVLMQLSQLIQELPPEQLNRMQMIMHNLQAGFDVRHEMEEFERSLPAGFRERIMRLVGPAAQAASQAGEQPIEVSSPPADVHEARRTILRAVASGSMSPEEAEKVLFP